MVDRGGGRQEARAVELHQPPAEPGSLSGGSAPGGRSAAARAQSRLSPRPDSEGNVRPRSVLVLQFDCAATQIATNVGIGYCGGGAASGAQLSRRALLRRCTALRPAI